MLRYVAPVVIVSLVSTTLSAADDILIADFEGANYGTWQVTGEAFGVGPARGTLPDQMPVSGFQGDGLINTYFQGDKTTGTLTSPPLVIERDFVAFLIGGGGYEDRTCINLLLDGEVVRTAVGGNTEPGGSEELFPHHWDVKDLAGKTATIQIVDDATGGWGHINVDHIRLTDRQPAAPNRNAELSREIVLEDRYLLFPIRTGAREARIDLQIDGVNVREFDAELARTGEEADFWAFLDVSSFSGKSARLRVRGVAEESVALIHQADEIPGADMFYSESLRPQFHFSQQLGWNNDPNGMVYHAGQWHLFFQHNPYGWNWGNMHWGHAVSRDLVHWEQLPIAIYNKRRGDYAFSGGAVVDERNTTGWQTGDDAVIVASWTSTGRGECLAYSNDRGRTFTEYEGNPVVEHEGRDPKIIWYEPGQHWVMAVYDESDESGRAIALYTSVDMHEWKLASKLPGYFECPELVELPVDGDPGNSRWVVFAADAEYAIGSFDGETFAPEHDGKHRLHYGDYYASQIFSNTPDDRRIQIGWARIPMRGMPFNQTFTFPHQLTLRTTDDGVRLFAEPVEEIAQLHHESQVVEEKKLIAGRPVDLDVTRGLLDIRATFAIGTASACGLNIGAERVIYDVGQHELNGAAMRPADGEVSIQVLVDRPMLEIVGNRGRVYITQRRDEPGDVSGVQAFAAGGEAQLIRLEVHELVSIWSR